jgi:hypothetical protein
MKRKSLLVVWALLLLASSGAAQNNRIAWWTFGTGFGTSVFQNTLVSAAAGQQFVGVASGGTVMVRAGFLADTLFLRAVVSVEDGPSLPRVYALHQNYPNPFNPATTIRFELPSASQVSLRVYNILGQEVVTLVNGEKSAGVYDVRFNAVGLPSGMYVYRLRAGDFVAVRKLLILK